LALWLTFGVALQGKWAQADQTITGNLTVTGLADVQGNTLSMGTRTDNSNPGWITVYTDGAASAMEFDASRGANIWKWQENGGTSLKVQMTLDSSSVLSLYESGGAKIVLSPSGMSSFLHSVTFSGPGNTMPHQTLDYGSSSVLTEGLGDTRYLAKSGTATGVSAISLGSGTNASGNYSTAMGQGTTASGDFSAALGVSSSASSYAEVAMGQFNVGGANPTVWVATDPLLELGNGTSSTSRSDAFVVYKNGNVTISGNMTANGASNLLPNQTLTGGAGSVLTKGLADGLYLTKNASGQVLVGVSSVLDSSEGLTVGNGTSDFRIFSNISNPYSFRARNGVGSNDFYYGAATNGDGVFSNNAGTELVRISQGGSVGIGTTNPSQLLELKQNANVAIAAQVTNPNGGNAGRADVRLNNGPNTAYLFLNGTGNTTFGGANSLNIYNTANAPITFSVNNTEAMRIAAGNVGIGTTSPNAKLEVNGNMTVDGSDNKMPGQTVTGSSSVLTKGLADALYFPTNATALVEFPSTGATATGSHALALGYDSTAKGNNSLASGYQAVASGIYAVALGERAVAAGQSSVALNGYTTANGMWSTAMGSGSVASSYAEVALGRFNLGGGAGDSWNGNDPLLEVGNGSDASHLSDALLVSKNGNISMGGNAVPGVRLQVLDVNNEQGILQVQNTNPGNAAEAELYVGSDVAGGGLYAQSSGFTSSPYFQANGTTLCSSATGTGGLTLAAGNTAAPVRFVTGGTTSGTERVRIDSAGNVGIGTTSPTAKLEVNGAEKVSGPVTVANTVTATTFVTTASSGDIPMFGN